MEETVLQWISQYGYAAIFFLLMLGIIGLPVPDETLLAFTGYLAYQGRLEVAAAFAAALLGSVCGITFSYALGRRFGAPLIARHGGRLRLTPARLARAHAWFERAGRWSLTFGYFVPGVRHLTAYAAGSAELGAGQFALFAYSGGTLWCATFLSLGYFVGEQWELITGQLRRYSGAAALAAAVLLALYFVLRKTRAANG